MYLSLVRSTSQKILHVQQHMHNVVKHVPVLVVLP